MKLRFIVVDDAAFLREIIKNIITSAQGLCVGEAADGQEAIELTKRTLPDLVFLDMVMPDLNGIEAAKIIKEVHPEVKIIGCSTVDHDALIQKAFEAGFDGYVIKPFNQDEILDSIAKVFPHFKESEHGRT